MDDRPQPSTGNSRKRLRAEDRSASSYKLSTSPAMTHVREPRPRSANPSGPSDIMLPTPAETAPMLQPLHPPIPNYSVISQGVPHSSSAPPSNPDPPNNNVYNIALPLPNPGRAHRFCQVCDHVNHVRRKLCESCGAPKPSAQKRAVCVGPVTDSDPSRDRRPRPTISETYGFESQGYSRPLQYAVGASTSVHYRQGTPSMMTTEQHRGTKSVDPMIHHAHSLAMRGPGDEIPLLESNPRTTSYPFPDTQASHRLNQTLLNEPLINIGSIPPHQDPRNHRGTVRQPVVGGAVDFNQKMFPGYALDREQLVLPPRNGIPGQQSNQALLASPGQTVPPRRASQLDFSSHQGGIPRGGKGSDGMLSEEVMGFNRNNFMAELDTRHGVQPRFQNFQGMRQPKNEAGQPFAESLEGQGTTAYTYSGGQEYFPPHTQQARQDERLAFEESRTRESLATSDGVGRAKQNISLGRYMEHNVEGGQRGREDRNRVTQGLATSRAEVMTGQLQRLSEHAGSGHLDESARHNDDGRFAIESILMQHKNGRGNQG